jgi:hypothetical protein
MKETKESITWGVTGHHSLHIMHRVLSQNKLPVSRESFDYVVWDAC